MAAVIIPPYNTVTSWEFAIGNAIAQQRMEGLHASPEALADLERAARGEITLADGIRNAIARHTHGLR